MFNDRSGNDALKTESKRCRQDCPLRQSQNKTSKKNLRHDQIEFCISSLYGLRKIARI